MAPRFETFDLPSHWACPMLYGDHTGLSDVEVAQLEEWERLTGFDTLVCVSVDSDETDFRRWHDASNVLPLACDVARFTFDTGEN